MTQPAPMTLAPGDPAIEQTVDDLPFSAPELRKAIERMSGVKRVTVNVIEDNLLVNVIGGDVCKVAKVLRQRPRELKLSLVFTDL